MRLLHPCFIFVPLLLGGVIACDSNGPTYAAVADSSELSSLADQGAGLATNTMVFSLVGQEPLVLLYGQGPVLGTHELAMRYVQRTLRRGAALTNGPVAAAPMSFRALSAGSTCIPTVTGIGPDDLPIDSDHDGVPNHLKIDYGARCADLDSDGNHGFIYSGSVEFFDTGKGLWSEGAILKGFRSIQLGEETFGTLTNWANGTETVVVKADQVTDTILLDAGQIIPGLDHYFRQQFGASFVPDSGKSVVPGELLPPGSVDLAGEFRMVIRHLDGGTPPSFRMTLRTTTPLHFTLECDGWIDGGVLRGELNGDPGVGFQVTYPGCGLDFQKELFGMTP